MAFTEERSSESRNGPATAEPEALSFGSTLIERGIPKAAVRREFRPTGLVCEIEVPLPEMKADGGTEEG